ncbi:protein ENL isoform X1 [Zea mays]|uniref:Binding protein n=1 Tax=Zea mays TaxID=4577 RepID=K7UYT6_MAIZE|nr:protein ENL isoform X1 [Zea mays]AQK93183.1 Binding protein [Zea mays]|eukprot:XP_008656204.1 protein ENL isoform X1 [Zea mays]
MAAAAAAGAASSILSSTPPRRLTFPPAHIRKPLAAAAPKALNLSSQKLPPLSSSATASPPPPPDGDDKPDPIKLAFARAAAYKKGRDSHSPSPSPAPAPPPTPPPQSSPPSQPQASVSEPGSKEAFKRALEYRNGNGAGAGAAGGDSPLLGGSPDFGQNALISEEVSFGKRGGYEFDEADFLGLDFFEKKRSKGLPPGLAPAFEPLRDDDFPEVDIIVGDPSKFDKSPRRTEIQPVDNGESGEASQSTTKPNEADKAGIAPPSTVIETEEDEDVYRPTVRSWGMFPRPQNISKAYGGGRNIRLGGETQSAEEKAAKDKRTKELIAAYRNRQNMVIDAKTKAECIKALREGDEMMNTGRLKQALPYYEKVMDAVDFKTEFHGRAALQWSICLDSLCRSKEAMSMYSKLKNHPNSEISKKANMFVFSFQAMDFMKVSSIPVPKSTGYETYFTKFGSKKNYYASLEEPEVGIEQIVPYIIFLVSPIFLVAFVALRKSFQL